MNNPTLGDTFPPSTEVDAAYARVIVIVVVVTSNLIYLLSTNLLVGA